VLQARRYRSYDSNRPPLASLALAPCRVHPTPCAWRHTR